MLQRTFQEALRWLEEARGWFQCHFMFRMSVVFKGSKALGRECAGIYTALGGLCVSKFQGHLCSFGSSRRRIQNTSRVRVGLRGSESNDF